jgi:DNA/RNA-binding domain of Phe-tRNA-synthetase-like protein
MLTISDEARDMYHGAFIGLLVMNNVNNPNIHKDLEHYKTELEKELRTKYNGMMKADLKHIKPINAYVDYYKKFKKTYHVLLQLESIVFKYKSIPTVASLVEAMFIAEMKNLLLTAGHDLDAVKLPVKINIANGTEKYTQITGQEKTLIKNDMFVSDAQGVTSSIIYGPDKRTRIKSDTRNVLFVVYAPSGIEKSEVLQHLKDIQYYVNIVSPNSQVGILKAYSIK